MHRLMSLGRCVAAALGVVALLLAGCRGASPLTDSAQAQSLVADLRLHFHRADKASTQAVMADTDEGSRAFAQQAQQAALAVKRDVAALQPILERLRYAAEGQMLSEFQEQWSSYDKLDQQVLALAVENTNLKAQQLSFGPAREAADAFRDAVSTAAGAVSAKERCGAMELAQQAIGAVREIQVLQAPHIAEADDEAMTRLEQKMAALERQANDSLKALSQVVGVGTDSSLAGASASLARFREVSAQIVGLSRRNTNVRSLALSLREQASAAAACDASLSKLQSGLEREGALPSR